MSRSTICLIGGAARSDQYTIDQIAETLKHHHTVLKPMDVETMADMVNQADVLVVEITLPRLEAGFWIAEALRADKPIILCCRDSSGPATEQFRRLAAERKTLMIGYRFHEEAADSIRRVMEHA